LTIAQLSAELPGNMSAGPSLVFSCAPDNDLFAALGGKGARHDDAASAVRGAPDGAGVLILADGYPARTTEVGPEIFEDAARRRIRLYVEYPCWLPGVPVGMPRAIRWERIVVASDAFGPGLGRLRILGINDCSFLPMEAAQADLVAARVAGFDSAVFGLPRDGVHPVLFTHLRGEILVAATKLSQFITARYAPSEAWGRVWERILVWLRPGAAAPSLRWTPHVRPSHGKGDPLPADAEERAIRRGIAWFTDARLLVHPSWGYRVDEARKFQDQVGPAPGPELPSGDGSLGLLEGFNARIRLDGTQAARWWLRNDCMGESSMAFAFHGVLERAADTRAIAVNLQDYVHFKSPLAQGSRADPASPSFGLVGWNTTPKYHQDMDGFGVYYGDDNARSMLGTMATAALLGTDCWDEPLARCLLANLRTTGSLGFRGDRLDEEPLQRLGWRHYREQPTVKFAPHFESWLWACFLWAHARTGYAPFIERCTGAIRATMDAYSRRWRWTNGIQQERARMVFVLAWLVRAQDTPEHRAWLESMTGEMLAGQDASGAIREELGPAGMGDYGPPKANEDYGIHEAALIQANGDPLADLLYTNNFAFLALHEAAAATGSARYREAGDRLAAFLCRVQVRSERHPQLSGAWFRAFDFGRWDYWGSNADAGWGAWSIETGWTQAWIISVLAMRRMGVSLWGLTAGSGIRRHVEHWGPRMLS
jgi:hypothetical protein